MKAVRIWLDCSMVYAVIECRSYVKTFKYYLLRFLT